MKRLIFCTAFALVLASQAMGAAVLDVVETTGDYYTITAQDSANASVQYWQAKVDVASGSIFMFKDLTDAGDGAGDHTDYMGGSDGYNRRTSLLWFDGRGGNVMCANTTVTGLSDRLSFSYTADSFTISYAEDANSTGFYHNSYGSVVPGDVLTSLSITINAPTSEGTAWDWSKSHYNATDHTLTGKVFASDWVASNIYSGYAAYDEEESLVYGPWDANDPKSFGRYTVAANSLGLTEGLEIILDTQTNASDYDKGGSFALSTWASRDKIAYTVPFVYGDEFYSGQTVAQDGQLLIGIAVPEPATMSILALGSLALLRRRR